MGKTIAEIPLDLYQTVVPKRKKNMLQTHKLFLIKKSDKMWSFVYTVYTLAHREMSYFVSNIIKLLTKQIKILYLFIKPFYAKQQRNTYI